MAIVYTDPNVVLARYAPFEPIISEFNADVIEGLHYLWRRHAQSIYRYVPQVPFETTSASPTAIGDNDSDPYAERLNIFPMVYGDWRPSQSGDVELTVVAVGSDINLTIESYNGTTPDSVLSMSVGAGPTVEVASMPLFSPATDSIWYRVLASTAGTGELFALYVFSSYTEDAPR